MNEPSYTADEASRFWGNVAVSGPNDCWLWKLGLERKGYGIFCAQGQRKKAHRVSLILEGRTIATGMVVDHVCRNRACVNPAHLRVVTPKENALENSVSMSAINAAKTHCKRGHELTGDNLRISHRGHRLCRECAKVAQRVPADKRRLTAPDGVRLCMLGHRLEGENLRIEGGRQRCLTCLRSKWARRDAVVAARKAAA